MSKAKIITFIIALGVLAVVLGFFLVWDQTEDNALLEPALDKETRVDLGITYLPVTPRLSAYYGLGVDSGALITEVVPGSPTDLAGIKEGDIIISFNGAKLEREVPLLGMMMACPAGNTVILEVWRETEVRMIELFHGAR